MRLMHLLARRRVPLQVPHRLPQQTGHSSLAPARSVRRPATQAPAHPRKRRQSRGARRRQRRPVRRTLQRLVRRRLRDHLGLAAARPVRRLAARVPTDPWERRRSRVARRRPRRLVRRAMRRLVRHPPQRPAKRRLWRLARRRLWRLVGRRPGSGGGWRGGELVVDLGGAGSGPRGMSRRRRGIPSLMGKRAIRIRWRGRFCWTS